MSRNEVDVKGFLKMAVLENKKVNKRARSRPPARSGDETFRLMIEAAAKEFQANGYSDTGIGRIAERAGLSTRTIYELVDDKGELFALVVDDRTSRFVLNADDFQLDGLDPMAALSRILAGYGKLSLSPETIAMTRLVMAEAARFPEIGRIFHEKAVVRINAAIEAWLAHQVKRGAIALCDPRGAAGMLRGMMLTAPQRAVFLGQSDVPAEAEIEARARACAALFLRGCLMRPVGG